MIKKEIDLANRLKITFPSQPFAYFLLRFRVDNASFGYSKYTTKLMVPGTPVNNNQVKIGATFTDTMNNLLANLNANNLDGNLTWSLGTTLGELYVDFITPGTYTYLDNNSPGGIVSFALETITVPEPETLAPLVYKDISIRIFDTYTNTRILQEEVASASACKIDWDSGDDLYKSIMASKLVFNMRVADYSDAYFIHLFSGDEQRYRIEVIAVAVDLTEQIIWQGFLLPDQYKEPFTNDNLFVDFTATDMLASMKGKYLEPWYYQNTLPIAEVFAYCLAATGLQQNIIVNPSVVPAGSMYTWANITVPMQTFINGEKYDDCYSIIDKLCASNVLTIKSYRGYWWLDGIHTKVTEDFTSLQFDATGARVLDIVNSKSIVDVSGSLQPTPSFTALTPWKKANVNFKPDGTKNLFSERVVKVNPEELSSTSYTTGNVSVGTLPHVQDEVYNNLCISEWNNQLNSNFLLIPSSTKQLAWKVNMWGSSYDDYNAGFNGYNYTEAMVLSNYIECNEQPYISPGVLYELQLEFTIKNVIIVINPGDQERIEQKAKAGDYDKLIPWQLLIDDVEKFSNRPSIAGADVKYEVTAQVTGYGDYHVDLNYKLKFQFRTDVDGFVKFRILMPMLKNGSGQAPDSIDDNTNIAYGCVFYADLLKITAIEGLDENGDLIASRPVNFTQEYDCDLTLSCTIDNSVINSFGIGSPTDTNYIKTIDMLNDDYPKWGYHFYAPATALQLDLATWKISNVLKQLLFSLDKKKCCFIESADGLRKEFSSLWFYFNNPIVRMGYLTGYDGYPNIPKNYNYYPNVVGTDVLKYMYVPYPTENFANRLNWKISGSDTVLTYPKAIAAVLHGVQPEMIYRLEASALKLLFPDSLLQFYFDDVDRLFIPTKLSLDLFGGRTSFVATEAKYVELTDITYE